jgi:hypothetical protein
MSTVEHAPIAMLHAPDRGESRGWIATCTHGCCHETPPRYGLPTHATETDALDAARELVRLAENGPDEPPSPTYEAETRDRQDEARDIETVRARSARRCPDCQLLQDVLETSHEQIGYEEQAREVLVHWLACGHHDETPLPRGAAS